MTYKEVKQVGDMTETITTAENISILKLSLKQAGELFPLVPAFAIDWRSANRQLMTVSTTGEITFADDLTIDEAKYIIQEIIKWKMK